MIKCDGAKYRFIMWVPWKELDEVTQNIASWALGIEYYECRYIQQFIDGRYLNIFLLYDEDAIAFKLIFSRYITGYEIQEPYASFRI